MDDVIENARCSTRRQVDYVGATHVDGVRALHAPKLAGPWQGRGHARLRGQHARLRLKSTENGKF
jgi:hypothetical protein